MMTLEELSSEIDSSAIEILIECVGEDYADEVWAAIRDDVVNDVYVCSDAQHDSHWNDDDVRLAIGRVLADKLEIAIYYEPKRLML